MSQISISEYHCKSLLGEYLGIPYAGISVAESSVFSIPHLLCIVKPDMKFGGRGKLGLLGVKLDLVGVNSYLQEFRHKQVMVKGSSLTLSQFLVEEFVPHDVEYYLAMDTNDRAGDTIYFSAAGGVEVENNWDQIRKILVPTGASIDTLISELTGDIMIQQFISQIYRFFTTYGFSYLEFNPFVIMDGQIKVLDAVAKVDSCESYRQKQHWGSYELVDENYHYEIEKQIADADIKSGASMKLSLINPDGAIWLILGGGGVSVATFDTLVEHGYHSQIANYGELSGNPTTADNYEYTSRLIQAMCASSAPKKYLMIVGGIANFTNILDQMTGICKALDESLDIIKSQDITLLIRRGGIQDVQGLALLQSYCEDKQLNYKLFGGELYLTDIISYITF